MAKAMLGLLAETSIHAGTGQTVGAIDLPIQREKHTGYPCVYGSAIKGALRTKAEGLEDPKPAWVVEVFGPDTGNASAHAGALAVSDARLLLLPVRSLTGHYKLVTCPAILERFKRDMKMLDMPVDFEDPSPAQGEVITHTEISGALFLEELVFKTEKVDLPKLVGVIGWLAKDFKANLEKQLIVTHNDDFAWYAKYATAVTPHIAMDNNNKTVKSGALWYEESLPPDTLLYCMLLADKSRGKNSKEAKDVLGFVTGMFTENPPYLQIGGNETVGMGWCNVSVVPPTNASEGGA